MKNTVVIYHGNCCDGFGAAFAAWLALGDSADYLPYAFEHAPPDVTGKTVFVLDFSFPAHWLAQMDRQADSVTLLDHHKSAAEELTGFRGCCSKLHFDLTRCGSHLAWRHFHPRKPLPKLLAHVEDRDLLAWRLPDTRAYLAALDAEERTFQNWLQVMNLEPAQLKQFLTRGLAMAEQFDKMSRELLKAASPITILGERGLMVNATGDFTNDVGKALAERSGTFGAVWAQEGPDVIKVGLRGAPGYDVMQLAIRLGGGGHPYAAAFRIKPAQVADLLTGKLLDEARASA